MTWHRSAASFEYTRDSRPAKISQLRRDLVQDNDGFANIGTFSARRCQQERHARIVENERHAIGGIIGIEGDVGGAGGACEDRHIGIDRPADQDRQTSPADLPEQMRVGCSSSSWRYVICRPLDDGDVFGRARLLSKISCSSSSRIRLGSDPGPVIGAGCQYAFHSLPEIDAIHRNLAVRQREAHDNDRAPACPIHLSISSAAGRRVSDLTDK